METELAPEILHQGHTIMTIPDVLTARECAELIAFSEGIGFGPAPLTTAAGFVMNLDVRNNTRVIVDDPERAEHLWERLRAVVPAERGRWRAVGLNERFRFYRYEHGQQFAWHRDGAFVRGPQERSHLTLLLYLNEGCVGGATEFDLGGSDEALAVAPRAGSVLLFAHHVRHQGAPVHRGRKYVLRSDVMYAYA